jgi:hypothetical protein
LVSVHGAVELVEISNNKSHMRRKRLPAATVRMHGERCANDKQIPMTKIPNNKPLTKIPNNKPVYDLEEKTFQFAK